MTASSLAPRQHRRYVVLYALLATYFCWPLFERPNGLGIYDWDQHLFYYASVLKNVVEYGQMPFWNPWYCGGNVLWQNPQVPLLSPVFPLTAVVSLPLAMKINIVLHYWVGLVGMHLLLVEGLGLTALPAVAFLSSVGVLGGGMAMHLAVGHSVFLPCLYLPLQLHYLLRTLRTGSIPSLAAWAGLLALMIYNGALHAVPMSVGAIGCFGLCATLARRDWRPLTAAMLLVILGSAYAAPKLLPVTLWVKGDRFVDARTVLERPDAMTADAVGRAYLDRYQDRGVRFEGQRSGWYEYGNYIGGLAMLLILASLIWPLFARSSSVWWQGVGFAVTAALLLALSAGEFAAWAPASLATHVPLFADFRIPSRYTIAFIVIGAASAGWMLKQAGINAVPTASARAALALVSLLGVADLAMTNRGQLVGSFSEAPMKQPRFGWMSGLPTLTTDATSDPYLPGSPMLNALMEDRSFFNCYESLQTARASSPDGELITVNGTATVSDVTFSPNRIEFNATGGSVMAEVSLNQNPADGWSSSVGPVVRALGSGRPAARLGPGETGRFAFTFRPPGFIAGMAILIVALGATGLAWRRPLLNLAIRAEARP